MKTNLFYLTRTFFIICLVVLNSVCKTNAQDLSKFLSVDNTDFVLPSPTLSEPDCKKFIELSKKTMGNVLQEFQTRVYANSKFPSPLNYRLFVPKNYSPQKKYPLVLYLHGGGAVGTDNFKPINQSPACMALASSQTQDKNSSFVLAPQCHSGKSWVTTYTDNNVTVTQELRMVAELIFSLEEEFNIDPRRIYITGGSMGGYGSWCFITEYPKLFAAASPQCGGGNPEKASIISKIPLWVFHGDKDGAVPVKRSRDMIEAIKKAGGNPRYTEMAGGGHLSPRQVYYYKFILSNKNLLHYLPFYF